MDDFNLCIIILNWNSAADTSRAIKSLLDSPWHVTVVDNASSDPQEADSLGQANPQATILRSPRNLGYAGGMNVGLRWASANGFTHALLLNPDTSPNADVIESMISQAEGYAVVGTAQVTEDMTPYVSAARLRGSRPYPFTCEARCGIGHDVDVVSGAALMLELETARELEYIDERFFHYKEEFDYCFRVKASGRKVRYSCGSPLIHRRGGSLPGSSPAATYYSYRNELLFLRKHFGPFGWLRGLGIFRNAFTVVLKSPGRASWVMKGLLHGLRGTHGPLFALTTRGL